MTIVEDFVAKAKSRLEQINVQLEALEGEKIKLVAALHNIGQAPPKYMKVRSGGWPYKILLFLKQHPGQRFKSSQVRRQLNYTGARTYLNTILKDLTEKYPEVKRESVQGNKHYYYWYDTGVINNGTEADR